MSHTNKSPLTRLIGLLRVEKSDIVVLSVYTTAVVLLTLAVPLAMQALVNTVAAGLFEQPLVVLTLLVFVGLAIAGFLQLLQIGIVETLQQRVFAKTAMELVHRLVRVKAPALRDEYAPELVNRFFDVLTIQKSLNKLLLDGLTAVVQATVALLVLGFYNPMMLIVGLLLIVSFAASLVFLGYRGVRTSIDESHEKYHVVDWLQDVARCHSTLKLHGEANFAAKHADQTIGKYLDAREGHFRVVRRQHAGYFFFAAVSTAGILASGGYLVLAGNMTIGQLVAAQILVSLVLASLDKIVRQTDKFFDLLTGLEKVGHILDLECERTGGRLLPERSPNTGATLVCRNVRFQYATGSPVLAGLNLVIGEGNRVSLVGASGAGKSTLAALICGLEEPTHGVIEVDGVDVRDADLTSLRACVAMVGYDREIFDGTLYENIVVGREHVSHDDVNWAIEVAQLTDDIALMPRGLGSPIVSGGGNLSGGQIQRVLIARAIVDHPRLLILDEAFTGLDERIATKILDGIFSPENHWTIIDISHQPEVVLRTATVHVLADGQILESGSPIELSQRANSEFSLLFPYLSQLLRNKHNPAPTKSRARRDNAGADKSK